MVYFFVVVVKIFLVIVALDTVFVVFIYFVVTFAVVVSRIVFVVASLFVIVFYSRCYLVRYLTYTLALSSLAPTICKSMLHATYAIMHKDTCNIKYDLPYGLTGIKRGIFCLIAAALHYQCYSCTLM